MASTNLYFCMAVRRRSVAHVAPHGISPRKLPNGERGIGFVWRLLHLHGVILFFYRWRRAGS